MGKLLPVLLLALTLLLGGCTDSKEESTDDTTTSSSGGTTTSSAPANLTATGGNTQITLDWDNVSGATSYTVYWDNASGIDSSDTAITSISNDNYTHFSRQASTTTTRSPPSIPPGRVRSLPKQMQLPQNNSF